MPTPSRPRTERGLALPVVLIFVLIITLTALFSMRTAIFGENISRNQLDLQLARQAAEAALRDAERDLLMATGDLVLGARCARKSRRPLIGGALADFDATCTGGQCTGVDGTTSNFATRTNPAPWWPADSDADKSGKWNDNLATKPEAGKDSTSLCDTFKGGVPLGTFTAAPLVAGVSRQPEYLIEVFGSNDLFRITARGFGADSRTEVLLQTQFSLPQD